MATIDKSLPNEVRKEINIPSEEDLQVEFEQETGPQDAKGPVDVQEHEDGSVDIDFDPSKVNLEGGANHFSNLAEYLPDSVLDPLGAELADNYTDYKSSRKE